MPPMGPPGHAPRFTAYTSRLPQGTEAFVFAQYACQAATAQAAAGGAAALGEWFAGAHGPDVLDRGSFVDVAGAHNVVWMAYWVDPDAYDRWQRSEPARTAWEQLPTHGPLAHWREVCVIPAERTESLHTHRRELCATSGLSQHETVELAETRVHDYWGAARDRIPASAIDGLEPSIGAFAPQPARDAPGPGGRVSVTVPGEVALIRTAQDWSESTLYRETYLTEVKPVKDRGVDYLADTPQSGCIAARNIAEETADGSLMQRACTVAWFASLSHLMDWCREDRTHLEIYESFFRMIGGGTGPLDIAFWHEVSVLPSGAVTAEYINCHARTGFLPLAG